MTAAVAAVDAATVHIVLVTTEKAPVVVAAEQKVARNQLEDLQQQQSHQVGQAVEAESPGVHPR